MEDSVKTIVVQQNASMEVEPFTREWVVSFKNPGQLWTENWFALTLEVTSAFVAYQLFRNAKKNDPKTAYLLLTAMFAVVSFEMLPCFPRPGYQLWWYHQGFMNLLKQRLPSLVISVFALVHYMANGVTSRTNLPAITRSTLTAICATLMMFPCLWLAPRLLLIFFHLDDPVFQDRLSSVPYIQLVVSLLLFFHTSHLFHQNFASIDAQERNTFSYVKCAIHSGLVAGIYTIIEQYLLYLLISLICHSNTGFCLLAAIAILFWLSKAELNEMQMTSFSVQGLIRPMMRKQFWIVFAALLFTASLPLWLDTHSLKSVSEKLEIGPCHITHEVSNTSPLEIPRRRYVCPDDVEHLNFDFHCLTKEEIAYAVGNRTKYYTVCGKEFENPSQIFKTFVLYSTCCLSIIYTVMLLSFTFKIQEDNKTPENVKKIE